MYSIVSEEAGLLPRERLLQKGAENTGEAAPDRTAALADSGTFRSRSRIAVSWMVDRSKKKRLFQGSDGAGDPSGSRSSGDLRV